MAVYIQIISMTVQIYTFNLYITKIWVYVMCKLLLILYKFELFFFKCTNCKLIFVKYIN